MNVGLDILSKIAEAASVDVAEMFFNDEPSPDAKTSGSIAIFVSQEELALIDRARHVLGRAEELSRRATAETLDAPAAAAPDSPTNTSD